MITIPIWNNFYKKYSLVEVMTLSDYDLKMSVTRDNNKDTVFINNDFYTLKNYKINLTVDSKTKDLNTNININGVSYKLDDFEKSKDNTYTIIVDEMYGGEKSYDIFLDQIVKYSYNLEENY